MTPESWTESALEEFAAGKRLTDSRHTDELGYRKGGWEQGLDALFRVAAALPDDWDGRLSLGFYLRDTLELQTIVPTNPRSLAHESTPPEVILDDARHFTGYRTVGSELYIVGIAAPEGLEAPNCCCEFYSGRGPNFEVCGWEYSNELTLHYLRPGERSG